MPVCLFVLKPGESMGLSSLDPVAFLLCCRSRDENDKALVIMHGRTIPTRGRRWRPLATIMLSTLLWGCASDEPKLYSRDQMRRFMVSHVSGDALSAVILLEALRSGDVDDAIEALENSLDSYLKLLTLTNSWKSATEDESVQTVVERIREYRSLHPRLGK